MPLNPETIPIIMVTEQRTGKVVREFATINHQLCKIGILYHAIEIIFLQATELYFEISFCALSTAKYTQIIVISAISMRYTETGQVFP